MLFYHSSPAVSHYIYFHTLKCNLNPNCKRFACTKSPLGSASSRPVLSESLLHVVCYLKQVIIIDLCVCLEKAIGFSGSPEWPVM